MRFFTFEVMLECETKVIVSLEILWDFGIDRNTHLKFDAIWILITSSRFKPTAIYGKKKVQSFLSSNLMPSYLANYTIPRFSNYARRKQVKISDGPSFIHSRRIDWENISISCMIYYKCKIGELKKIDYLFPAIAQANAVPPWKVTSASHGIQLLCHGPQGFSRSHSHVTNLLGRETRGRNVRTVHCSFHSLSQNHPEDWLSFQFHFAEQNSHIVMASNQNSEKSSSLFCDWPPHVCL